MKDVSCEIICVGTELLLGDILNTNAQYLSKALAKLGINVFYQTVVGDNPDRLGRALSIAKERADIIITTGGLGPTCDDLTKETVAASFNRKLIMNEACLAELTSFFTRNNRVMTENNKKQAIMPEGSIILDNPQGTAPGCLIEGDGGKIAIMMPGPPRELEPMFENKVKPYLRKYSENILVSRTVRMIGIGESAMEAKLIDLMDTMKNPTLAPYAKTGECLVRVTAKAHDEAEAYSLIDPQVEEIKRRLGEYVYGVDVDSLEEHIVRLLSDKGLTLAFAEAGTGGYAIKRMYDVEGSSEVLKLGFASPSFKEMVGCPCFKDSLAAGDLTKEVAAKEIAVSIRKFAGTAIGAAIIKGDGEIFCAVASDGSSSSDNYKYPQSRSSNYVNAVAANRVFDIIRQFVKAAPSSD